MRSARSVAESGEETADGDREATGSVFPGPVSLPPLEERPLVSVLIPNKDYGRFLGEALDGLLAQTYERWEAIVCDDGSSDDSREVVARYAERDARISLIPHDRTRGQGAAFNTAFAASTGSVVALLDADDVFRPAKLQRTLASFADSDAGLVVHPLVVVDADGTEVQRIPSFTRFERGWIAERVVRRGGRWRWVPTSGVALRRGIAELVFPMPEEGFLSSADTYFLMLAPLLTPVGSVDEVLASYRRHGSNHFARTRFDTDRVPKTLQNLELSVACVNERLEALGRSDLRLRAHDNLKHEELEFQQDLFGAAPRSELKRRYHQLMNSFDRDDLYGGLQRRWARVLYRVAIDLPSGARPRWVGASLSATRPKEWARRVWTLGRRSR